MSTMTINGKLAPLPDDPDALLVDVVRDAKAVTIVFEQPAHHRGGPSELVEPDAK